MHTIASGEIKDDGLKSFLAILIFLTDDICWLITALLFFLTENIPKYPMSV